MEYPKALAECFRNDAGIFKIVLNHLYCVTTKSECRLLSFFGAGKIPAADSEVLKCYVRLHRLKITILLTSIEKTSTAFSLHEPRKTVNLFAGFRIGYDRAADLIFQGI